MNEHNEVRVHQAPDKSFHITFDDGITVGGLADALASLPSAAPLYDVCTTFHDPDDEDGEGQPEPDKEHWVGITTISTEPNAEAQDVIAAAEALLAGGAA